LFVTGFTIAGAAVIVFSLAALAIWLVPRRQIASWRRQGITDEEKLAELGMTARTGLTQALGGLALVVTLAITAYEANQAHRAAVDAQKTAADNLKVANRNLRIAGTSLDLTRRGQVSERFAAAAQQLGATGETKSAALSRSGAMFSLRRLALDSPENVVPILLFTANYIATRYQPSPHLAPNGCKASFQNFPIDLDIALRVVLPTASARPKNDQRELLQGFTGADFNGLARDKAFFSGFDLTGTKFRHASLNYADFRDSNLSHARFDHACLRYADFRGANLKGARLDGADLHGAKFQRARLRRSDLPHVPLSVLQRAKIQLQG
jgi:hypothetical protein